MEIINVIVEETQNVRKSLTKNILLQVFLTHFGWMKSGLLDARTMDFIGKQWSRQMKAWLQNQSVLRFIVITNQQPRWCWWWWWCWWRWWWWWWWWLINSKLKSWSFNPNDNYNSRLSKTCIITITIEKRQFSLPGINDRHKTSHRYSYIDILKWGTSNGHVIGQTCHYDVIDFA